jgi:hypothetical protein
MICLLALILQEDVAKLNDAAGKLANAKSYAFTIESKIKGIPGNTPTAPIEGQFEKDKGLHLKIDRIEIVRVEDKVAMTQEDGTWQLVNLDAKKDEKKKGQGRAESARELPHELFGDLGKKFTKFDGTSGDLTSEGAVELMGGSLRKLKSATVAATAKVTFDSEGRVEKIEISGTAKGKFKDQEVDATLSRVITFSQWDSATAVIPEGAQKALEGK